MRHSLPRASVRMADCLFRFFPDNESTVHSPSRRNQGCFHMKIAACRVQTSSCAGISRVCPNFGSLSPARSRWRRKDVMQTRSSSVSLHREHAGGYQFGELPQRPCRRVAQLRWGPCRVTRHPDRLPYLVRLDLPSAYMINARRVRSSVASYAFIIGSIEAGPIRPRTCATAH